MGISPAANGLRFLRGLRDSAREFPFDSFNGSWRFRKPVDDSGDTALHPLQTKVQDQSELQLRQHQMRAQLLCVDRMVFLNRFNFQDDRLSNQQVHPKPFIEFEAVIEG